MTVKDFTGSENRDDEAKKTVDEKDHEIKSPKKNEKNDGELTEIKNAHASGDGSFGRNESGLPDEEVKNEQGNNAY